MTAIEWTDETWNVFPGCSICEPECIRCYAMREAWRLARIGKTREKYRDLVRMTKAGPVWTGQVRFWRAALSEPFGWKKPRRVFVNSMGDTFHESVPDAWLDEIFDVMEACPQHQFQVLTKRPDRMRDYARHRGFLMPHIWVGTSIGRRRSLAKLESLRETPATVRFVSFEPLLEDLGAIDLTGIDWAIVGAESGRRARPMALDWVRNIRDQCRAAGVAFFFKQTADARGNKQGLPLLDGRQWRQWPTTR
jgi:protein gp37